MQNLRKIASHTFTVDESLRKVREITPTDAMWTSLKIISKYLEKKGMKMVT